MEQNGTEFEWTNKREQAAAMVAEDRFTDEYIVSQLGVGRTTLNRWKAAPEFAERVASNVKAFREAVMITGIADKANRIARLDRDWKRMQALVEARAAETERDVPGASTGVIVRSEKETKYGTQIEHSADTALFAELRATEMQAAKELGQWSERTEHSGSLAIGAMSLDNCSTDDLRRRLADAAATLLSAGPVALREA